MASIAGQRAPATGDRLSHSPLVGEHSRAVLAELGMTAAEIDRLVADGIVDAKAVDSRSETRAP
jgi:crotonobetainyl-CoA:carnitine CoA-transferase CaiB-like acyl-CoA transferase